MNLPADKVHEIESQVRRCWPAATALWSRFLLLSDPDNHPESPSVAQIDLATRQVSLNWPRIIEKDLVNCIEGMLAHEVGHHVRFPGTLQVDARMRLLERSLLPFKDYSLINLFTDLMINEFVGRTLRDQLIRIYQAFSTEPAFHQDGKWKRDPVFLFYLSLYEELWHLEPSTVMGPAEPNFAQAFRHYRVESQLLVQNLFAMGPNVYAQFLYFLSFAVRYLKPLKEETPKTINPNGCGGGEPSPGDWADAITPTPLEHAAIEQAIKEGWFDQQQSTRLGELNHVESRIAGLPGHGTADARQIPEIMAAYYRQQAETMLFCPPPQPRWGEAVVPTTLEAWEAGDSVREIDWLATLSLQGEELGAISPLKRSYIAEQEGFELRLWQPRIEIYLDVSGSMPNPCCAVNAMTLAAQILTLATVRAGGWVRALIYSQQAVPFWEWCRSETEMSRFLMHYVGGGTQFPFAMLDASIEECRADQPIRIVITDRDFDTNFSQYKDAARILLQAAQDSPHFILMQHMADAMRTSYYRSLGVQAINVAEMQDLPRVARDLAWTLFPEGEHGLVQ